MGLPKPHGGKLINRIAEGKKREELLRIASRLKKLLLNSRQLSDLEMIAIGALSPLEGFMGKLDYQSVIGKMRLKKGFPWTIPITLAVSRKEAAGLKTGQEVALVERENSIVGLLALEEKYPYNKEEEARQVYKTTCSKHPGVQYLQKSGEILLGGKITLLNFPKHREVNGYLFKPLDTRRIFKKREWKRIAGFQTRNPIHRAHEYIQKCALEIVDGLLIHPLVGETKSDDIPAKVRMDCYQVLIENYYPAGRVILAVMPAAMRYAGPKEAILHAIVRKNYGCTHFIVGRDHAGVGDYYGSFEAHHIFDEFEEEELGITPLFFDYTFYCQACQEMASRKTCPHNSSSHLHLSGSELRAMLQEGKLPPVEFTRPEVAKVLIEWTQSYKGRDQWR